MYGNDTYMCMYIIMCTVEPLYKGHHRGKEILASIERCPCLILASIEGCPCPRGTFVLKRLLTKLQCGLSRESVLTSGVVVKRGSTVYLYKCMCVYPAKKSYLILSRSSKILQRIVRTYVRCQDHKTRDKILVRSYHRHLRYEASTRSCKILLRILLRSD